MATWQLASNLKSRIVKAPRLGCFFYALLWRAFAVGAFLGQVGQVGQVGRRNGAPEGCHSASCKFAGSPGEFIEPAKSKQKKLNSNA